ncbi:MAG: Crp/Fnr family transcriptional regulator [Chitinophagales bacterium]|nr:Crp/Fnr family transcriptional regulator [Chitinophagaceae bacterium]MCB9064731.1 Crp/Fnr family transcriptional regulator [Chitinophagales bacterium]
MSIEQIRISLSQFAPIDDEAWEALSVLFEPKSLKRNEFFYREGDRPHNGSMLLSGVLRVFYTRHDGVEYNKNFFIPGMSPTPITALVTGKPCAISFQALTDSELMTFNFAKFLELADKYESIAKLYTKILEQLWVQKELQEIQMVTNDAQTNYDLFRQKFPGLEQQIPQYHIASYLGITPIQLSRIRAKMSQGSS